jgi:hypothetical protein
MIIVREVRKWMAQAEADLRAARGQPERLAL